MITGFSSVNALFNGHCRPRHPGGLVDTMQQANPCPAVDRGLSPDVCLHFHGQHYESGQMPPVKRLGLTAQIGPNATPLLSTSPIQAMPPQATASVSALTLVPALTPASSPVLPPQNPKLPSRPGQSGFRKVCRTEEASPCPFRGLLPGVLQMRVKEGSKIRNLMGFAMARMQGHQGGASGTGAGGCGSGSTSLGLRQVIFTGSGRAVTKTITCAEIMKRKLGGLHQLTKLSYKGVREVWESQEPSSCNNATTDTSSSASGSSEMTVHRTMPSISILLSKDPLDPSEPGYQPPMSLSVLWGEKEEQGPSQPEAGAKRTISGPLAYVSQPSAKRLCVGAGISLCCPLE